MIIGFTGHRPDRIGNEWNHVGPCSDGVQQEVRRILTNLNPSQFICGLAQGGDILSALVAIDLKIQVTAAIPFESQESTWSKESKELYARILSNPLVTKKIISPGGPHNSKYHIRNRWIVDQLQHQDDRLLSLWDESPSSGTAGTVEYAKKKGKEIIVINPLKLLGKISGQGITMAMSVAFMSVLSHLSL